MRSKRRSLFDQNISIPIFPFSSSILFLKKQRNDNRRNILDSANFCTAAFTINFFSCRMLSFSQFSLPSVIRIVYDVVSRVTILLKNGLSFRSRGSTSLETFDPRLIPNFSHLFISQKSLPVAKLSFEIRLTPRISFDSQDSRFHT